MDERLRLGVVGLGRLWEARYKPALARLKNEVEVATVYDQVFQRAEWEARQLGCTAAGSLHEAVASPQIDAVLLLAPQWFGLYPMELACELGKPVYAALHWASQAEALVSLADRIRQSGMVFMPEMPRRCYPSTIRLRTLLENELGPARLIMGHARLLSFDRYELPGPGVQLAPGPLASDPGHSLIDWCRFVFNSEPTSAAGASVPPREKADPAIGPDYERVLIRFTGNRAADISIVRQTQDALKEAQRILPEPGFQVFAERGVAWVVPPDHIQWSDASGIHQERTPLDPPIGELLLTQFLQAILDGDSTGPSLDDALAAIRWSQAWQSS